MKKLLGVYGNPRGHWVGNGFPVRSLFNYEQLGKHISPFLLLDYAGPHTFSAGKESRGVGQHPHRGFETVTIVYQGELEHRDSTGAGGLIGPGDVQWMTAGAGILHEEFHTQAFVEQGGTLEMVQLWVNLPAKDKMAAPGYQTLLNQDIQRLELPQGQVRVIAGQYQKVQGPAKTFSPINVWDLAMHANTDWALPVPDGHSAILVVLDGSVQVNGSTKVAQGHCAVFDPAHADIQLHSAQPAKLLLLSGEPLDEPIVGYGPFVMNSQAQIREAMFDFQQGRFGSM